MPKTLTATPEFVDQLTVPRDGEAIDARDVNTPFQALLGLGLYTAGLIADLQHKINAIAVAAQGFTLNGPASLLLEPNRTYQYPAAITLGRVNGYNQDVALQALDLPAGVTATFTPATLSGAANSADLKLDVSANAVPGIYNVTILGTGGGGQQVRALIPVTVTAATLTPGFDIQLPTDSGIDRANHVKTVQYGILVTRTGNFSDPITFSLKNLPAGISAAWSVNPVTGSEAMQHMATVLTLTAGDSVPAGTYSFNVQAVAGNVVRNVAVSLMVSALPAVNTPDFKLDVVYDAGDPNLTNGATVYITRLNGFTGPVNLSLYGLPKDAPNVLVNGQALAAPISIEGNTARIAADGVSKGWSNSGIADLSPGYTAASALVGVLATAVLNGQNLPFRSVAVTLRYGNRMY